MKFDTKRAFVEFIGTFCVVFLFLKYNSPVITGLSMTLCLIIGGNISSEVHYNPILSTIRLLLNKLSAIEYISTLVFQVLGGYLAFRANKYYNNTK